MKRVILIFIAISVALMVCFGVSLNVRGYLNQFNDIPKFTDLIDELNGCWTGVGYDWESVSSAFASVNDVVSFFSALGSVFTALWSVLKGVFITLVYLPTKLLVYVIMTIWAIIPHSFNVLDFEI